MDRSTPPDLHPEAYRALVEGAPVVLYIDRPDELSTNLYTSPQIVPLLGYDVAEWMDDPELWVRCLHPEDRDRVVGAHEASNSKGERFLEEYHALAPENPRLAYDTLTGPTLRSNVSYETYAQFWGRFSSVRLRDIAAQNGFTTATAVIDFEENGETFEESHRFTLAVGEDGQLLMDVDEQV